MVWTRTIKPIKNGGECEIWYLTERERDTLKQALAAAGYNPQSVIPVDALAARRMLDALDAEDN